MGDFKSSNDPNSSPIGWNGYTYLKQTQKHDGRQVLGFHGHPSGEIGRPKIAEK